MTPRSKSTDHQQSPRSSITPATGKDLCRKRGLYKSVASVRSRPIASRSRTRGSSFIFPLAALSTCRRRRIQTRSRDARLVTRARDVREDDRAARRPSAAGAGSRACTRATRAAPCSSTSLGDRQTVAEDMGSSSSAHSGCTPMSASTSQTRSTRGASIGRRVRAAGELVRDRDPLATSAAPWELDLVGGGGDGNPSGDRAAAHGRWKDSKRVERRSLRRRHGRRAVQRAGEASQSGSRKGAIGTVDKFQGQQAPVVFFSMASSSAPDAPRGIDFLMSRNRLNVAVSRAQCLAYLACAPALLDVDVRTIEHMRLANALCRFVELAV